MNKKFADLLQTENGIVYPNAKLAVGGFVGVAKNDEPYEWAHNLVVNEGLTDLLDVYLKAGTQTEEWYVAPWSNNVNPASSWTAANFTATAGEFTAYDESARPIWTPGDIADQTVSSVLSDAEFTINSAGTIYGAALLGASAKSATTGKLFSAFRFANPRDFESGDVMHIAYFVQAQSTS